MKLLTNSLGVFPDKASVVLSSFADMVSKGHNVYSSAKEYNVFFPYPPYPLKAGYTTHSYKPQNRFNPLTVMHLPYGQHHKTKASTGSGSFSVCHYGSPAPRTPRN